MINLCVADNFPVVHFGMKAYFKDHPEINVVSNVGNFFMVPDAFAASELIQEVEKSLINNENLITIFDDFKNTNSKNSGAK